MAAPTEPAEPTRSVIEQAAAWQAQLADAACDDQDRQAFDAWLNADPAHRIVFDRMGAIEGKGLRGDPVKRTALKSLLRPRRSLSALAVVAGLVACAGIAAQNSMVRAQLAGTHSDIGEVRPATLATGDRVTLDSHSAVDIGKDRSVRLWRGAVMADVRKGVAAPFVVRTAQGTARALGTRFSVRVEGAVTTVAVIESRVEACASQGRKDCVTLSPGQSARLDTSGVTRLGDVDKDTASAWSEGLLVADDRPLGSVLDELNRYRKHPVRYAGADIEGLRLTGTFPLTDTDRALVSIAAAMPVTIDRTGDDMRLRRK